MSRDYMDLYRTWRDDPFFDERTHEELAAIEGDENEIKERFYKDLEFGTAGLRGILGAGTNRMNIYTVGRATQGLANYIVKQGGQEKGVAIAYDCRHMSPEFADAAAGVLAANGIRSYLFESLRPTPELSFAVRHLGCMAGINVTASHNPAEYNGYKVYWEDGAQITPPHDTGIMEEVLKVSYHEIRSMERGEAEEKGLCTVIGADVDEAYDAAILDLIIHQDAIDREGDTLKIVYTPLHGAGNIPVQRILKKAGFKHVTVVPEQEMPDGDFPTVPYPNPETDEAFKLGLEIAKEQQADLVLATDPDADRIGVHVRDDKGQYHALTGNMSGCLLADYVVGQRKAQGLLPDDAFMVTTIVSTNLTQPIAASYGVELREVLTGFKYIGEQILLAEESGTGHFQFGYEESYGSLPGSYARDKDAVAGSLLLCEAAAWYKRSGKTLWDAMEDLYRKHGWYSDGVRAVTHAGAQGLEKIASIMEELRKNPPQKIGAWDVLALRDYKAGERRTFGAGSEISKIDLPQSNVLYFELTDRAWVCVRPSGTEPKIKLYCGVCAGDRDSAGGQLETLKQAAAALMDSI